MDLHDGVQQTLIASKMAFDTLKTVFGNQLENHQDRFLYALEILNQSLKETRDVAHSIMPKQIKEYGFIVATENMGMLTFAISYISN